MDCADIFQWDAYTEQLFWEQYYLHLLLHSQFIRPYASEVTKQLINEGHTLIFITARKDQDLPYKETHSMFNITSRYLQENHIYYSDLILSSSKKDVIYSKHINIMIEDNPVFFKMYGSSLNIPLLCFDTLYNSHISYANVVRVYSWYDILQKIHLLGRS